MPPIPLQPVSFSDPEVTLAISALQQREIYLGSTVIQHIATLPSTTPLLEQQRLAEELREDLEDFGKRVEGLEQLVEDLDTERERVVGREVVRQWAAVFAQMKKDARTAILSSKQAIDMHAKSRRDELLGSAALFDQEKRDDEKTGDALMRTTQSLTDALRRTETRLRAELDRSMLSTQLLTSQTATLRQTSNAHGQLSSLLDTSKNLVTALEKTDWLDRMLILGALAVFLLTCAYIIKVRVFDRALWIAFWWVKWMPSWKDDRILDELERGARLAMSSARSLSSTVSTLASSATSTAATPSTTGDTAASSTLGSIVSNLLSDDSTTITRSESTTIQTVTSLGTSAATAVTTFVRDEL